MNASASVGRIRRSPSLPDLASSEDGVSLVESVLAVGILGLSLVALLNSFAALGIGAGNLDRGVHAESVAHSVAESILNQPYQNYPGTYATTTDVANPRTYALSVTIEYASDPAAVDQATPPTFSAIPAADHGLQRITVTVTPTQGSGARTTRICKRR